MYKKNRLTLTLLLSLSAVMPRLADASNGYFDFGHGTKNKGMAGAGIALPQDAMAAATNPAGMVFVGDRVDFGVEAANQLTAFEDLSGGSLTDGDVSEKKNLYNVHLGYNGMLDPLSSIGVTIYTNGRASTSYIAHDSIDLLQQIMNLSYAHRFGKYTSLGGSLVIGYQQFSVVDPILGNGPTDTSYGYGWKMGFQTGWKHFIVAGSYQTKIAMGALADYALYLEDGGNFDIPSTYTFGLAVPFKHFAAVLDYQRINYSGVPALGNPSTLPVNPGIGWQNVSVLKLGTQVKMGGTEIRLGYSKAKPSINSADMEWAYLMPYVVESHASIGFTQKLNEDLDLSVAYTKGLTKTLTGIVPSTGDVEDMEMTQNSLEFSLAVKF